jgi:hypothetical protein
MERFLTNFKQKCPVKPSNEGRKIKRQKYETEKRKRDIFPSWTTTYTWLENGSFFSKLIMYPVKKMTFFNTGIRAFTSS